MKLKSTHRYVDKYSKKIIECDTILEDVSESRAKELIAAGVAAEIPEPKKRARADPKQKENEITE